MGKGDKKKEYSYIDILLYMTIFITIAITFVEPKWFFYQEGRAFFVFTFLICCVVSLFILDFIRIYNRRF